MAKLSPRERWEKYTLEKITALKISGELEKLRETGLNALGRKRRYSLRGWHRDFQKRATSQVYREWFSQCKTVGDRFGVTDWVVAMLCLVRGFKPEANIHVMTLETLAPSIRIVTENNDPFFLALLTHEAQKLGLYVVQRTSAFEATLINMEKSRPTAETGWKKPPAHAAFRIRVETPPGYPPEGARELHKKASRLEQELRKRLGYSVSKRLRSSSLVSIAEKLKLSNGKLSSGETYELIDRIYADQQWEKDQKRHRIVKSRRHYLRKRLLGPSEQE
jgi:hypothetical protein